MESQSRPPPGLSPKATPPSIADAEAEFFENRGPGRGANTGSLGREEMRCQHCADKSRLVAQNERPSRI